MALPVVTATRHQRLNGTTSVNAAPTTTPNVGEWVIVALTIQSSTAAITPPSGWTVLKSVTVFGTRSFGAWAKIYQAGDSFTFGSSISTNFSVGTLVGTGADSVANWIIGTNNIRGASIATTTAPGITTTVGDTLALAFHHEATNAVEAADPTTTAGWTKSLSYWNTVASTSIEAYYIAYKDMAATGATGDMVATWPNASANGAGYQIGIPAPSGGGGAGGTITSALGSMGQSASGTRTIPSVGFKNIQNFFGRQGATSAHRGLSASYPEMSSYAYTRAQELGYGMLEISTHRTSDGVWFGIHDSTMARTSPSGTNTGVSVTTLTWAQVQANQIEIGSGAPQPYSTLSDLIDTALALDPNVVFMVDPKNSDNQLSGLLDLLDTKGGTTRFAIKMFGQANVARFQLAKSRGYRTIAYFYDDTPEVDITSRMEWVDSPGMNWDAAQSEFDFLLAYGKPVWAHVVASQTNYNTGISKGARWVQISAASVTAVSYNGDYAIAQSALGSLSQSANGTRTIPNWTGTANSALAGLAQSAAGIRTVPNFSGTATSALSVLGQSASGTSVAPVFTGSSASALGALGQSATGGVVNPPGTAGSINSALGAVSQSAAGTRTIPPITASAVSALLGLGQSATGAIGGAYFAVAVSTLSSLGQSVVGTVDNPFVESDVYLGDNPVAVELNSQPVKFG